MSPTEVHSPEAKAIASTAIKDALRRFSAFDDIADYVFEQLRNAGLVIVHPAPNFIVETEYLYSDNSDCSCCEGRHRFSTAAAVVQSDWPTPIGHMRDLAGSTHRAIESFPDRSRIEVSFRLAGGQHVTK